MAKPKLKQLIKQQTSERQSDDETDDYDDLSLSDDSQDEDERKNFSKQNGQQLHAFDDNFEHYDDDDNVEELLPLESGSESDADDDVLNRYEAQLKKDEMASDMEEEGDDHLPDVNAWGTKKAFYYSTDYVDKDFREYKQRDEQLAAYEEEEALAIQKRLLESINEEDIGIDMLIGAYEPTEAQEVDDASLEDQVLDTNIDKLTDRQKVVLLRKESPELEPLIKDFRTNMTEIRDKLLPLMQLIKEKKIPTYSTGVKYIEARYQILINYCINICFYMSLKAKRVSVKEHPVIKQLLAYKKLLIEFNRISDQQNCVINSDMEYVLHMKGNTEELKFESRRTIERKRKTERAMEKSKRVKFAEDNEQMDESDMRRKITYEIEKNKGLTPKRKKEQRNPRVKHKMKYRKAKIRRKGQVREPRKELQRYRGELSGINTAVVKSVRFR